MELNIKKASKKEVDEFNKVAWSGLDIEHYNKHVKWVVKPILLKITDGKNTIATIDAKYESGVIYINKLTVAKENRKKGVGRMMMEKIEAEAINLGAHKIFLITGKDWIACKLYESLDYKITADLKNHYLGFDFVIYSKMIN